jgi:CheY-specific phosphatase CheX
MTTKTFSEPNYVLPRTSWPAALQEAAASVFSMMAGDAAVPIVGEAPKPDFQVTGMIGIAGAIRANFILQCSSTCSHLLAARMLGVSAEDLNDQKASCDAMGEMCNMLAGDFKSRIGLGFACMLSVPTVIRGSNYQFRSFHVRERIDLWLQYGGETLLATVAIEG